MQDPLSIAQGKARATRGAGTDPRICSMSHDEDGGLGTYEAKCTFSLKLMMMMDLFCVLFWFPP